MKIPSKKTIVKMDDKDIEKLCLKIEDSLQKKGWYEKSENGTLNEEDQKTFDKIMELFQWIRIYAS